MSKKIVKSLRGEEVDFDMLRIKSEIGSIPETADAKFRENIIQSRRRRKNTSKRKVKDMLAQQQINQKAVMVGLEKQRKQREDDKLKNTDTLVVSETTNESANVPAVDETEVKTETFINRKIRKNHSNEIVND